VANKNLHVSFKKFQILGNVANKNFGLAKALLSQVQKSHLDTGRNNFWEHVAMISEDGVVKDFVSHLSLVLLVNLIETLSIYFMFYYK
jgi:hypothetical protein